MQHKPVPPNFPLKLLRLFCKPEFYPDIEGDLLELYDKRVSTRGRTKASWFLFKDVLLLLRPGIMRTPKVNQKLNYKDMLQHSLLMAFRNFKRYKSAFFINLIGLSTALASVLLILIWINDELNVDKFHALDDRLYQVMGNYEQNNNINTWNGTSALLPEALTEMPEMELVVGGTDPNWNISFDLTADGKKTKAIGKYVGKDYFHLFSYELIQGKPAEVLADPSSVVISASLANKLYGGISEAIGKSLEWKFLTIGSPAKITGVFEDPPSSSTDQFEFVLPFALHKRIEGAHWESPNAVTYVLLKKHVELEDVNFKLVDFMQSKVEDSNVSLFLKPYSEQYLYNRYENGIQAGGRIDYVNLFSIIALFILIIAVINFVNLSTARVSRKMKEVGVKKVVGARRSTLIAQFLIESIVLSVLATIVAVALAALLLPEFNQITGKVLKLPADLISMLSIAIATIATGALAGIYPAIYLTVFKPASALRSNGGSSGGPTWVRKGLVVFQFALSITLIVAVLVVSRQLQFIQTKHLGYDRENVILFEREGKAAEGLETFLAEIKNVPGVKTASVITNDILSPPGVIDFQWEGQVSSDVSFSRFIVHYDFIEALGVELIAGRSFSRAFANEPQIVLNEKAVEVMGLKEPIGAKAKLWGHDVTIVGVVKDFNYRSLHEAIGPMFFHLDSRFASTVVVKLESGNLQQSLVALESFYKEFNPGYTFDFRFLDQDFQALYDAENKVATLSFYFASIAIIISCLGLFGLAAFTTERRIKEIGIRKVLGSSVTGITKMLSMEFTIMVLIAIAISLPISFILARSWLTNFAYSVELSWWLFASAAIAGLAISWLTIGLQTIKAARSNPVDCLRDE